MLVLHYVSTIFYLCVIFFIFSAVLLSAPSPQVLVSWLWPSTVWCRQCAFFVLNFDVACVMDGQCLIMAIVGSCSMFSFISLAFRRTYELENIHSADITITLCNAWWSITMDFRIDNKYTFILRFQWSSFKDKNIEPLKETGRNRSAGMPAHLHLLLFASTHSS